MSETVFVSIDAIKQLIELVKEHRLSELSAWGVTVRKHDHHTERHAEPFPDDPSAPGADAGLEPDFARGLFDDTE